MKTNKNAQSDYIKANRRGSREAEIENHGRPVNFCRVQKSKKVYDRNRRKADDKRRLPSFLSDILNKIPKINIFHIRYSLKHLILYCIPSVLFLPLQSHMPTQKTIENNYA